MILDFDMMTTLGASQPVRIHDEAYNTVTVERQIFKDLHDERKPNMKRCHMCHSLEHAQ
ncbi:hypothetical protein OG21DRAFT_1511702 [Imleria badia]|nr:hypothetical protein OG21DRAFT_1511702 [Imleria badia]